MNINSTPISHLRVKENFKRFFPQIFVSYKMVKFYLKLNNLSLVIIIRRWKFSRIVSIGVVIIIAWSNQRFNQQVFVIVDRIKDEKIFWKQFDVLNTQFFMITFNSPLGGRYGFRWPCPFGGRTVKGNCGSGDGVGKQFVELPKYVIIESAISAAWVEKFIFGEDWDVLNVSDRRKDANEKKINRSRCIYTFFYCYQNFN